MSRVDLIQIRNGTAAQWTTANPVLAIGEMGVETDTRKTKIGDGVTTWNALLYSFYDQLGTQLAGATGASLVGYTQGSTGSGTRTVQAKLRETASLLDFGAVGDGITDDTVAMQAALTSGKNIDIPLGYTFKFTADLSMTANNQRFGGAGTLAPSGNCGVIVTGGSVGVELDLAFNSSTHTGIALKVDNANRVRIRRLYCPDVKNMLYVRKANTVTLDWCWATCRGYGITWYGDAANRSDILQINYAVVSVSSNNYGLDWDGNCNTLIVKYLGIVCGPSASAANGYGVIIRNTAAAGPPQIGKFGHIEVDYCGTHAVDIQAGSDFDFIASYLLGATGSGIRIGATINSREVRVTSGKSRGHTRYGIENLGSVALVSGNMDLQSNTLGETTGLIWSEFKRVAFDANFYSELTAGNPISVYDANDYLTYDRTNNLALTYIGGAEISRLDSVGIRTPRIRTGDDNCYLTLNGTAVNLVFDASDYTAYDRTNNALTDFIGGVALLTVSANGFGYGSGSGAGGTVTQATSKATGVTLNKPTGAITLNNAALAASTAVSFTLTNSTIAASDVITVAIKSGATAGAYVAVVDAVAAGSCQISLRNLSAGSLSEAVVLTYAVVKGATA